MDIEHAGLYEGDARELARKIGADPAKMVVSQVGGAISCPECGSKFGPMMTAAPEVWTESVFVCCGYSLVCRSGKTAA